MKLENAGSRIVAALEIAFASVQEKFPELENVIIVSYQPPGGTTALGHFWRDAWKYGTDEGVETMDEIMISPASMADGATEVMRVILHEAAHQLAKIRGIQDTSRQGRYHNKKFAILAEEVGLEVAKDPSIGTTTPNITVEALEMYAEVIAQLDRDILAFQDFRSTRVNRKPKRKTRMMLICGCGTKISIKISDYAPDRFYCDRCQEYFDA